MSQSATLISLCLLCVTLPGRAIFQTRFIGHAPFDRSKIDEWKESIFIINYNKPHPGGVITSWSVYVRNEGQFALLVLRKDPSNYGKHVIKYMDEYFISKPYRHSYLKECESSGCFTMQPNDLIGFYFKGGSGGLVPYDELTCSDNKWKDAIYYVESADKPVSSEVGNSYQFLLKDASWGRCRSYSLRVSYNASLTSENPWFLTTAENPELMPTENPWNSGDKTSTTTQNPGLFTFITASLTTENSTSSLWYVYVCIAVAVIVLVVVSIVVTVWMFRKSGSTTSRQRLSHTQPPAYPSPMPNHAFIPAQNPAFISAQNPAFISAQNPAFISAQNPVYIPASNPAFNSAPVPVLTSASAPVLTSAPAPVHTSASAAVYPPLVTAPQSKRDVLPPSCDNLNQPPQSTLSTSGQLSQYNDTVFLQGYDEGPPSSHDNPAFV